MFMVTERLFLRPLWPEDAESLTVKMGAREVLWNLGSPPNPYRRADADAKIAGDWADWPLKVSLAIFMRTPAGPDHVGGIGFSSSPTQKGGIELGYWIAKDWWGQGIAVEAARPVIAHAFVAWRLPRLVAGHYEDNPPSGRVLQKLGFRPTGEISLYDSNPRGSVERSVEYVLLREDWEAERRFRVDPAVAEAA